MSRNGLRIFFLESGEEQEYTVDCDEFTVEDGSVLHTWSKGGAYGTYDHQWFVLRNILRWAKTVS